MDVWIWNLLFNEKTIKPAANPAPTASGLMQPTCVGAWPLEPDVCPACQSQNIVTLPAMKDVDWMASFLKLPNQRPPPARIQIRVVTPIF